MRGRGTARGLWWRMMVLGLVAMPLSAADAPADLLQKARELWYERRDPNAAAAAFDAAVAAAPEDDDVRMSRATFYAELVGMVREDVVDQVKDLARRDFRYIAEKDPNSILAGIARDALAGIDGIDLVPLEPVACDGEAREAYANAETRFFTGQHERAVALYQVATSRCPKNAGYWIGFGDAHYLLKEYERAAELFRRAIEVSPWHRQAHRFLADTEIKLGHLEPAFREAALAIVSDPSYEAAWNQFRGLAEHAGADYRRVYGQRAKVFETEPGEDGNRNLTIQLPSRDDAKAEDEVEEICDDADASGAEDGEESEAETEDEVEASEPPADLTLWMLYGIVKASAMMDARTDAAPDEAGKAKAEPSSAFVRERDLVKSVLDDINGSLDREHAPFWWLISEANRAGFLDEAVYLHMAETELIPEYREYREKNRERLIQYLFTVVAPVTEAETDEAAPEQRKSN